MHPLGVSIKILALIQKIREGKSPLLFFAAEGTRKIKSQYAGGILLPPVQKLVATLIFARPPQGRKCKRVPSGVFIQLY